MLIITNRSETKLKTPKIGEHFEIQKGNRKGIYKIIESTVFKGCYELIRCENSGYSCGTYVWREKPITGCQSVEGCAQLAYDVT